MCDSAVRFFFTCAFGLLIGAIYWRKGNKRQGRFAMCPPLQLIDANIP